MASTKTDSKDASDEAFPWHIGVFDAHCHPTDTMSSILSIATMKTQSLTIMATRSEDLDLVSDVATRYSANHTSHSSTTPTDSTPHPPKIIPAFGWHPWFSHQILDDSSTAPAASRDADPDAFKLQHYQSVLTPCPPTAFIHTLPPPLPLSHLLTRLAALLALHPAALVGEVGLDRAFRLPEAWGAAGGGGRDEGLTPGGREGRRLSPYRVDVGHQRRVLRAQLELAGREGRAVSMHGVQAHGVLFEAVRELWRGWEAKGGRGRGRRAERKAGRGGVVGKDSRCGLDSDGEKLGSAHSLHRSEGQADAPKPFPPRICLHSYSGPAENLRQYFHASVPVEFFVSFSTAINFGVASTKTEEAIRAVPQDRILTETDLHTAGLRADEHLEDICKRICVLRGWGLEEGVTIFASNWKRFVNAG